MLTSRFIRFKPVIWWSTLVFTRLFAYKQKMAKTFNQQLNKPQMKGIITEIRNMTPKKPNSAIRKVAKVMLTQNKKQVLAYIPGEGHSLTAHNEVLVCPGKIQDLVYVKYKCVRGALDFKGVVGRKTARSKYGTPKPSNNETTNATKSNKKK